MGWMMLGMVLFWGLVIFLAILMVRALFETGENRSPKDQETVNPLEVLDLRYSRGEINQEQYFQMRKDLEQTSVEI
jgi:putative membrane protein